MFGLEVYYSVIHLQLSINLSPKSYFASVIVTLTLVPHSTNDDFGCITNFK